MQFFTSAESKRLRRGKPGFLIRDTNTTAESKRLADILLVTADCNGLTGFWRENEKVRVCLPRARARGRA